MNDLLRQLRWRFAIARLGDALFIASIAAILTAIASTAIGIGPILPTVTVAVLACVFFWQGIPTLPDVAAWLDRKHNLSDLLSSAWSVRNKTDEPWAASLWSIASATAANLPRSGRLGRFGFRHHACTWAAAATLWLGSGLIHEGQALAGATVSRAGQGTAITERTQTATITHRAGDTAESATPASSPVSLEPMTAVEHNNRRTDGTTDAEGAGRADGGSINPITPDIATPQSRQSQPHGNAPGGSGAAAESSIAGDTHGTVTADHTAMTIGGDAHGQPHAANASTDRTDQAPAAYREMIRDFFSR